MAGASIRIELDDRRIRTAFNRLLKAGADTGPLMRDIGEHLVNSTRERFREEEDPRGKPWAPLSEVTLARKTRNSGRVLTERGFLGGSIAYRAGRKEVEVGAAQSVKYAGVHQFGAAKGAFGTTSRGAPIPWGDIPARPFLGLSRDDETSIRELVNDYLAERLR